MAHAKKKPQPQHALLAQRLRDYMAQHGLTITGLAERIYGRGANGASRGSGGLSLLVRGREGIGPHRAALFKDRIGLDLSEFVTPLGRPRLDASDAGAGRAERAVAAYAVANGAAPPPLRREAPALPRFALTIAADGRGSLTLNLIDLPAAEVLRALQVLQAAGLIEPGAVR